MLPVAAREMGGRWWRLALGTMVLLPLTPGSLDLAALTLAALLLASGSGAHRTRELAIAAVAAGIGLSTVAWISSTADPLATALGVFSLLAAVAFTGGALLAPAGALRQAFRAVCWAVAGVGLLGLAVRGSTFWTELHWSAVRDASGALRTLVPLQPGAYPMFEPLVRLVSQARPGLVILQTFAGLSLAWQWHVRIADVPLGPPLGPFRGFRFGDQWVWGLVAALAVWALPKLALLKGAAVSVGIVLGTLYLLRGAAILVTLAGAAGLPMWALAVGAVVASVLVLPLVVLVPSLWTLGVFDTWLAFRQRRFGRPTVQ